jgi:hypothetical protein
MSDLNVMPHVKGSNEDLNNTTSFAAPALCPMMQNVYRICTSYVLFEFFCSYSKTDTYYRYVTRDKKQESHVNGWETCLGDL